METIDSALQKAVWSRVRAGVTVETVEQEKGLTGGELLALMENERNGHTAYRRLSWKVWGEEASMLQKLAAGEAEHFQKLQTLFYLKTGNRAGLAPVAWACMLSLPEALRAAHLREEKAIRNYEIAAKRWPEMAEMFQTMAQEERNHCTIIRALLGRIL